MERVQELIDKLSKQHQGGEAPERLLQTVQSLQETLAGMMRKEAPVSGKVAVVLPPKRRATTVEIGGMPAQAPKPAVPVAAAPEPFAPVVKAEPVIEGQKPYVPVEVSAPVEQKEEPAAQPPVEIFAEQPDVQEKRPEPAANEALLEIPAEYAAYMPVPTSQKEKEPYFLQKPPAQPAVPAAPIPQIEEREVYHLHFDTPDEAAPTLTQQQYNKVPKEVHEMISETKESLNDRLKQDKPELAHKLKEAPIKDLRKAIGVNDKFLFVRELFRDDEAMYERSLKTINNFHILAEAEYWISRELKVKLGWDDSSHTVQAFYQLVKRRFS